MNNSSRFRQFEIVLTAGLALFAMFFGAGNMVFPLALGVTAGHSLVPAMIGFILSGVGLPFLGVFAVSLYGGDYWKFFSTIGKVPAFIVIAFVILVVGLLFGGPRTETITFNTVAPHMHGIWTNQYFFSGLFFAIVFVLTIKHTHVVDVVGRFISPLKLIAFLTLIVVSLIVAKAFITQPGSSTHVFTHAISTGYGTMDLLCSFFFCHVAYKNVLRKCQQQDKGDDVSVRKTMGQACLLGAFLIGLVYLGFMFSAAVHAQSLAHTSTAGLINRLSEVVLGQYGAIFVCFCVFMACLATAIALVVVSASFIHEHVFANKVPWSLTLLIVLSIMYSMSILGFDGIMAIAIPVLNVLYPILIVLCFYNIFLKYRRPATHQVKKEGSAISESR